MSHLTALKIAWNAAWRKALADYGDTTNEAVLCGHTNGARDKAFSEWYERAGHTQKENQDGA